MRSDSLNLWLVAEDSEDDFYLLQRACSRLSPQPKLQRATNGIEAQKYLAGEGLFCNREAFPLPSMVVADLKMPMMDGLELLDWFQHQRWQHRMPFVMLTASSDQGDKDRARAGGADCWW